MQKPKLEEFNLTYLKIGSTVIARWDVLNTTATGDHYDTDSKLSDVEAHPDLYDAVNKLKEFVAFECEYLGMLILTPREEWNNDEERFHKNLLKSISITEINFGAGGTQVEMKIKKKTINGSVSFKTPIIVVQSGEFEIQGMGDLIHCIDRIKYEVHEYLFNQKYEDAELDFGEKIEPKMEIVRKQLIGNGD